MLLQFLVALVSSISAQQLRVPYYEFHEGEELLFAQVVWRHGDRAPTETYPTDIHQENTWPNGWGELTPLGMRQQYALGRVLRARYMNESNPFLHSRYFAKQIYIRSTDVNRTLISAYANVAGMFSGGEKGKDYPTYGRWPSNWTPVPVHTIDVNTDHAGNIFAPCKRAEELDQQLQNSPQFKGLEQENGNFLKFLSEKTGKKVTLKDIYLINDVHHIEKIYNLSQPDWITDEVSKKLLNLTQKANEYTYGIGDPYVPELIRLRGGNMLKSIVDKMQQKLDCHLNENKGAECKWIGGLKYYAYSAHDTTVAALLTTFGNEEQVIRGGLPKYTASIAIELWMLKDGPAVRLLYHTAFHHNYHPITQLTHGCPTDSEFCLLKQFIDRSKKFMPDDIEKECQNKERLERMSLQTNRVY
ncbi:unnamed protein product, partial [Mesorhabditis belari]|uniref:Uncharacterized protein n=1 Tax=Mesorhabditis belari TaxID=2138241 RepID=A0AAF3FKQ7_9BILA